MPGGVGTLPKGEISTKKNIEPGISFENGGFALQLELLYGSASGEAAM